jgi:hypothetical protein
MIKERSIKGIYIFGMISWAIAVVQLSGELGLAELGLAELAMTIAQGPLVMGFVVAVLQWITGKKLRDPFTWTVLCVSLALLIVWLGLCIPVGFGFGSDQSSMTEKVTVIVLLLFGVLIGVAYSADTWRPRSAAPSAPPASLEARSAAPPTTQASLPGLFWFTLGLILAIGFTCLAVWISFGLVDRGPVTMRTTWGGEIHAHDKFVNAATGLAIVVVGWATGVAGWRRYQFPRPLVVGMIVGATFFGILFGLS